VALNHYQNYVCLLAFAILMVNHNVMKQLVLALVTNLIQGKDVRIVLKDM